MESADPAEVMAAIATCQFTCTAKIEAVQMDVGLIHQDMDKLCSRVTKTEQRIGQMEENVLEQWTALRTLQTKVKALEYRAEHAENRNRRNNLRIIGLPEGAEGGIRRALCRACCAFFFLMPASPPHYTMEKTHRVPPKPVPPEAPPRTFILRMLNFQDRTKFSVPPGCLVIYASKTTN